MSLSYFDASIPVFTQYLHSLDAILDKLVTQAESRKIDPSVYLSMRLYPDMFALTRQVQICCDFAKNTVARLAGLEAPKHADDETTVDGLKTRIAKVLAYLATFNESQFHDSGTRTITMPVGPNKMSMAAKEYLLHFALPNFFFHHSAAYAILRHGGIEIGKRDFLGTVPTLQMVS